MYHMLHKVLKNIRNPLKNTVRHKPYPVVFHNYLKNLPCTEITVLPNGLTVATQERECYNACVGLYINAGARYESHFENGITHFFEHIAFKGTKTRAKTLLQQQMSSLGAQFHCETSREIATYYAECLCEDVSVVVDILTDCVFNNLYCPVNIDQQKSTVYLEMLEHDKDHNSLLADYLHSTAFQGTPLAQSVLGVSSNLYNFTDTTISRYVQRLFDPNRTVLIGVGAIKHTQLIALAESYLSKLEPTKCIDTGEYRFTGSEVRYRDDSMPLGNVAIAVEGPGLCDPDNLVLEVASHFIGGWDRSQPGGEKNASRIVRGCSSEHLCDSYKAFNINYKDTGLWGAQFMGPSKYLDDVLHLIQGEWMRLCTTLTDAEVERAKRELKTDILHKTESCKGAFHEIGRWVLYGGCYPTLHERLTNIDKIFAKDVIEVCNRYIYDKCPAVAAIGTTEGLLDYTRIRAGMYWLRI